MVQRIDVVAHGGQALRHGHVGEGEQAKPPAQPPATLHTHTAITHTSSTTEQEDISVLWIREDPNLKCRMVIRILACRDLDPKIVPVYV